MFAGTKKIFAKLPIPPFVLVMSTPPDHPGDILHQVILYKRSKNVSMDRGVGIYLFCLCLMGQCLVGEYASYMRISGV